MGPVFCGSGPRTGLKPVRRSSAAASVHSPICERTTSSVAAAESQNKSWNTKYVMVSPHCRQHMGTGCETWAHTLAPSTSFRSSIHLRLTMLPPAWETVAAAFSANAAAAMHYRRGIWSRSVTSSPLALIFHSTTTDPAPPHFSTIPLTVEGIDTRYREHLCRAMRMPVNAFVDLVDSRRAKLPRRGLFPACRTAIALQYLRGRELSSAVLPTRIFGLLLGNFEATQARAVSPRSRQRGLQRESYGGSKGTPKQTDS